MLASEQRLADIGKLLESPLWDARLEKLIFVDTDGQKIHRFDPHAAAEAAER